MNNQIIDYLLRLGVENGTPDMELLASFVEENMPEFLRDQMELDGQIDFAFILNWINHNEE